jgi:hypothetical protein
MTEPSALRAAPNPKKTIKLDAPGKQGRYVKIQLLTKSYLSLAEVQVMGITSRIWITPRPDETTIFKGSKGICI